MDRVDSHFEWDEEKDKTNKIKHGVSFEMAALVFNDPNRVVFYDAIHSIDEERYVTIGRVNQILFVVFTERHEKIRLISARLANKRERKLYCDGLL